MLPRIVPFNAISLDGRTDGFSPDLAQFYEVAATWNEDAMLAGAETILKACRDAPPEDEKGFLPLSADPADRRPLLVVPDSRGRVRCWHFLKSWPYWRGFIALCSGSTPQDYFDYLKKRHIDCIIAGGGSCRFKGSIAGAFLAL